MVPSQPSQRIQLLLKWIHGLWNWKNVRAWQFLASALDLLGYRPLFWLSLPLPSFEPLYTRVTELPQELDHLDLYCAVVVCMYCVYVLCVW